tara:strand:+ start:2426 stop:2707 length:282 start_codon:yes stop_codon:yes gene_type:complete
MELFGDYFWTVIGIIAATIGSLFLLTVSHAATPKHTGAAATVDVYEIGSRLEGVSVDVGNNKNILGELRVEVRDLKTEQIRYSQEILKAVREN